MMVSLPNVLTIAAIVWFVVIFGIGCCNDEDDAISIFAAIAIIGTLFFGAVLLYRIGSLIFSIIGG